MRRVRRFRAGLRFGPLMDGSCLDLFDMVLLDGELTDSGANRASSPWQRYPLLGDP